MMHKYEVRIYEEPWHDSVNIIFFYRDGEKVFKAKHLELEFEEIKEYIAIDDKATIVLPQFKARELLHSLAEALDEKNIKTDKDAKIEGTLSATRYHLEDLRTLLKLKKGEK